MIFYESRTKYSSKLQQKQRQNLYLIQMYPESGRPIKTLSRDVLSGYNFVYSVPVCYAGLIDLSGIKY